MKKKSFELKEENKILFSKLEIILKENNSLKNKMALISKELKFVSKENTSLKNDLASHSCHDSIVIPSIDKNTCSTFSSIIKNEIAC